MIGASTFVFFAPFIGAYPRHPRPFKISAFHLFRFEPACGSGSGRKKGGGI